MKKMPKYRLPKYSGETPRNHEQCSSAKENETAKKFTIITCIYSKTSLDQINWLAFHSKRPLESDVTGRFSSVLYILKRIDQKAYIYPL